MEARVIQDERRDVARRLFAALCTQYPDRYIALIEQPEVAVSPAERRTDTPEGSASFEAITGRPQSFQRPLKRSAGASAESTDQ
jgi:hypothetical protein